MNWATDKIALQAKGIVDEHEREQIVKRTQAVVVTGRIAVGRWRPGAAIVI